MHKNSGWGTDFKWPVDADGRLSMDNPNVLYWYDEPLMCVGRSSEGHFMLASAIDGDGFEGATRYLVTTISRRRLRALQNNSLTVRAAYRFSKAPCFVMSYNSTTGVDEFEPGIVSGRDVPNKWLSSRGARLRYRESKIGKAGKRLKHGLRRMRVTSFTHPVTGDYISARVDDRKSKYADRSNCVQRDGQWYVIEKILRPAVTKPTAPAKAAKPKPKAPAKPRAPRKAASAAKV